MSETVTDVVIYARYSSHSQNETSIEGQLKVCYDYCEHNNYRVVHEYIDRAISGKTDNRPSFQQMMNDSASKQFKYVIVYQLDRFSRNRYDSAIYKNKLKKHGIRVLSAKENISEDASGILMESVLEGMAEYYSEELKQKVKRGLRIQAEKCLYAGGLVTYGYKINPDKTYDIEPITSKGVLLIFTQYANGKSMKEIIAMLKAQGFKTTRGGDFSLNAIGKILRNRKYIGEYRYMDIVVPNGIPRIVSDDLFRRVASKIEMHKKAPASSRDVKYILSSKLFCGYCHSTMVGVCGTGKLKKRYYYYCCTNHKNHVCDKSNVKKSDIEKLVLDKCRELLDDKSIDVLVKLLIKKHETEYNASALPLLEADLKDVERRIENLTKAIIDCDLDVVRKKLCAKMPILEEERRLIETRIAEYTHVHKKISPDAVRSFLLKLKSAEYESDNTNFSLVDTFVNQVYLYEDKVTIIYNTGQKAEVITDDMLSYIDDISSGIESSSIAPNGTPEEPCIGDISAKNECSSFEPMVVRNKAKMNPICFTHCFALIYPLKKS